MAAAALSARAVAGVRFDRLADISPGRSRLRVFRFRLLGSIGIDDVERHFRDWLAVEHTRLVQPAP